jgi:hypothetical protein
MIARSDKRLYRLKGKEWEVLGQNYLTLDNTFTAIEGGADGLWIGLTMVLEKDAPKRIVADLIFLKN